MRSQTCGRVDKHQGHWVKVRTLLGSRQHWCAGDIAIEGGSPARKGKPYGAQATRSLTGKQSKW